MNIDRSSAKTVSKALIGERSPHVFFTAAEHMIVVFIMTHLLTRLSGIHAYSESFYNYLRATGGIYTGPWPNVKGPSWAICIVLYFLIMIVNAGYVGYTLMVSRRQETNSRSAMSGFDHPFKVMCVGVLRNLIISLGFALFIVPGFIAAYSYRLVFYVLADNPDMSPIECLRQCRRMSKGFKMQLFMLDLSFIGWHLLNSLVESVFLPVVEIWLLPYSGITFAIFYNIIAGTEYVSGPVPPDGGTFPWNGPGGVE